jgi:4'-phosphopantetheinyl transferase
VTTVTVHTFGLDRPEAEVAALRTVLSDEERARADRFIFPEHRLRWTVARARMRELLGAALGQPPSQLNFSLGERGKPEVAGLEFNLSHTHNVAMLAISDLPVGVDVEQHRQLVHRRRVAERSFSAVEYAFFDEAEEPERTQRFFDLWTCKEAFIKAVGQGFAYGTRRFDVEVRPPERYRIVAFEDPNEVPEDWTLRCLAAPAGYSAALAIKAAELRLVQRDA